jgi:hypothetical protein
MKNNSLKGFLLMSAFLISASAGMAQITGTGTTNTVPLWKSSSTQGNSSITENPTTKDITVAGNLQVKGNLTANQLSGPLGVLLYHASFQGASQITSGNFSGITLSDGVAIMQAGNALNSTANLQSDNFDTTSSLSPNKPGSFLSLRLKALNTPVTSDAAAYFVAGGDVEGTPLRNGFGFKYVGGSGLKGVSIRNGSETLVDLATTLGSLTTQPPADLLAILRATSVQFFVNGVLKGTITTNLPSSSDTVYELRLINGTSEMQLNTWVISYLTVGFPAQGAPLPGTF